MFLSENIEIAENISRVSRLHQVEEWRKVIAKTYKNNLKAEKFCIHEKKLHFLIRLSEIITIFATVTLAESPQRAGGRGDIYILRRNCTLWF